jgi:hypothetical protein
MAKEFTSYGAGMGLDSHFFLEVAKGDVDKHRVVHKFGATSALGTSVTPVTSSGTYQTPTTATALEIVSDDDTNDKAGQAGAITVRVYGIAAWADGEVTEDVTLTGTTAAALSTSFLRVYRMKVLTSGTYGSASGPSHNSTITLRTASAGATWATIEPDNSFGLGQSEIGAYSIGSGKTAYIFNREVAIETTKKGTALFFAREDADDISAPFSAMRVIEVFRNLIDEVFVNDKTPLVITGPADFGYMGYVSTGTGSMEVDFEFIVVDD